MSITKVGLEEVWVVFCHESVCSLCIPKLELPFWTGVEFGATLVGDDPFLLHLQVTEMDLVDDSRDDFWRAHWWNEVLEVPSVSVTKDGMGQKGEGGESVQ